MRLGRLNDGTETEIANLDSNLSGAGYVRDLVFEEGTLLGDPPIWMNGHSSPLASGINNKHHEMMVLRYTPEDPNDKVYGAHWEFWGGF